MCMGGPGCSGHKTSSKSGAGYTPKKMGGNKGSYTPKTRPTPANVMSSFGKPSVRMSFSGRR